LVTDEINESQWQVLMTQVSKFKRLVSLEFNVCSIENITESQFAQLPELKFITIGKWRNLNE
jgi:hypothetical protein